MQRENSENVHVDDCRFGRIVIDSTAYTRDVKIVRGRVKPDWRRRRGHVVERDDIADILAASPGTVILGMGYPGRMRAAGGLKELLRRKGIELIEVPTAEAVERFNEMCRDGVTVCAGFHLTC